MHGLRKHHEADHHIVVVAGSCRVLGRQVYAGASAYVPAGTDHTVKAGVWGCTFVGECTTACPKGVDPAGAIQRYKLTAAAESLKSFLMPWRSA